MLHEQQIFSPSQRLSLKLSATNFLMVALSWAIPPWACHFHNSSIALTDENADIVEANIHYLGLLLSDLPSVWTKVLLLHRKPLYCKHILFCPISICISLAFPLLLLLERQYLQKKYWESDQGGRRQNTYINMYYFIFFLIFIFYFL